MFCLWPEQKDLSETLPYRTCATSWNTSCNRDGIAKRNWPPRRAKCSSTGRWTAIKRWPKKRPNGRPMTRLLLLIVTISLARRWKATTANRPRVNSAGNQHPSPSKSTALFFNSLSLPRAGIAVFFSDLHLLGPLPSTIYVARSHLVRRRRR